MESVFLVQTVTSSDHHRNTGSEAPPSLQKHCNSHARRQHVCEVSIVHPSLLSEAPSCQHPWDVQCYTKSVIHDAPPRCTCPVVFPLQVYQASLCNLGSKKRTQLGNVSSCNTARYRFKIAHYLPMDSPSPISEACDYYRMQRKLVTARQQAMSLLVHAQQSQGLLSGFLSCGSCSKPSLENQYRQRDQTLPIIFLSAIIGYSTAWYEWLGCCEMLWR